jgi:WD40 repeat protein
MKLIKIIPILFLLIVYLDINAQQNSKCYIKYYTLGKSQYIENKFDSAYKSFYAAKYGCGEKNIPLKNDLDDWLAKAQAGIEAQKEMEKDQKKLADTLKKKANELEQIEKQQFYINISRELANQSIITKDTQLQALLAMQSFQFYENNVGLNEQPIIYNCLRTAYSKLVVNNKFIIPTTKLARALFEQDGKIIYADLEGYINVWDINKSSQVSTKKIISKSPINTMFFSPSAKKLVIGCDNNNIYFWNLNNYTFKELIGHKGLIRAVAFSPNEIIIATAGKDSLIKIWELINDSIRLVNSLYASSSIKSIVFLSNGETLVSAQEDGKLIFWNLKNSESTIFYDSKIIKPLCLTFNRNKDVLLSGFNDGTVKSFDLKNISDINNYQYTDFKLHTAGVDFVSFNNDYSIVITASSDRSIKIINFNSYFENRSSKYNPLEIVYLNSKVKSLFITNDQKIIISCSDNTIRIEKTNRLTKLSRT